MQSASKLSIYLLLERVRWDNQIMDLPFSSLSALFAPHVIILDAIEPPISALFTPHVIDCVLNECRSPHGLPFSDE